MALPYRVAVQEAKMFTRNGYPMRVLPVFKHEEGCFVSDGTIVPPRACTCKPKKVGYSLQVITGKGRG